MHGSIFQRDRHDESATNSPRTALAPLLQCDFRMSLAQLKRQWSEFKRLEPGTRFQTQHDRHRRSAAGKSPVRRAAYLVLAIVCLAVGVVLVVIPGPAVLFFAIAAGLLAIQSRVVARACDSGEIRLRRALAAAKRWKRRHFRQPARAPRH
jgi:Flp pilus assembly protein TadB